MPAQFWILWIQIVRLYFTKEENRVSVNNTPQKQLFDWGNVAGVRRIKVIIERDILLPLKEREVYRNFNVSIPKGLLFYGPPDIEARIEAFKIHLKHKPHNSAKWLKYQVGK